MTLTANQKHIITGIITLLAVAIIAGIVWYVWFRDECDPSNNGFTKKGKPSDKCKVADPAVATSTHAATPPPAGCSWIPDSSFPLKKCMWGSKVKALQQKLGIGADGKFGTTTEAAVQKKFNSNEVTEAQYNTLVTPPPSGGANFNNVKKDLGAAGKTEGCTGCVYTTAQGNNTNYNVTFFTNGRVSFKDNNKTVFIKGAYTDGGKTIIIDAKDGGYTSGNYISNNNVGESITDIIKQIGG